MLQRETGGNLAEILTKLAYVIRQRFQLKRQVRAASAHGRLTAGVLTAVPIVTFLGMTVTYPGYVESLADYQEGRIMIVFIFLGQLIGYFFIRRIINIKV
jgi:tight adherence protein B